MEALFGIVYFTCFAVIAGGAFALMRQSIDQTGLKSKAKTNNRHPEAPLEGESVMYVDLSRERLERLYEKAS
ncbi:hypothetical protein KQ302_03170 [Synechococcus sp. CS-602]|uniref:hypothetical protein n=1 Tax=Synechococcaceae TaxID=1890426 RepID=UPI0008FF1F07|nr:MULTISPECIES: hypothetical protein [Synechococcaceae]MCT4363538.1 hypothetical protein [Candidatus Regnicoccus frigidus MAG-AL1]APD48219.1 hypothetical protein BM449_08165 [Synechococcus sp. SynAce01]MCT0204118.1 hypothetical protein [Synechococcus sp. CS-602]MCT0246690.1 hypothetical protein [Synechococcus sp. CS-601]MCT4366412.1 hypothetical protein [Candidatus Regnicoccus frigidus MAG-AL2]